jgi:hypothetical protein
MGVDNTTSLKDKSDAELEEVLRDSPHLSQAHSEAQSEWSLRERKQLRRPTWTRAIVAAILIGIMIVAYLRTC